MNSNNKNNNNSSSIHNKQMHKLLCKSCKLCLLMLNKNAYYAP